MVADGACGTVWFVFIRVIRCALFRPKLVYPSSRSWCDLKHVKKYLCQNDELTNMIMRKEG